MTVAALIEIGPGGHSEPGPSLLASKATGTAHGAASSVSASNSSVPAAASFRSSWQSLLASLNEDLKNSGNEATAPEEDLAAGGDFSPKTAGSNSATASPASVVPSRRSGTASAKPIAAAEGEENLSLAGTGSGISVSRSGSETHRQSAINTALKSGATVRTPSKEETAGNLHSVSAVKSVKTVAASGIAATVTPPANLATAQNVPVAIPAAGAEVQTSITTEALTQTPLTDLSSELPYPLTPEVLEPASSLPVDPGAATVETIASRNQAAGVISAAEAAGSLHSDGSGAASKETGTATNQTTETAVEAKGVQSSLTNAPVVAATVKSVINGQVEADTAATLAPREGATTARTKGSQSVEHGGTQNRNIEEVKSSVTNGLAASTAAVDEPSPSGRTRPQAESTAHKLADDQPRLQAQPAVHGVGAIATPVSSVALDQSSAVSNASASQSISTLDTTPNAGNAVPAGSTKSTSAQAASRSSHSAAAAHGDWHGQAVQAVQDGSNNAALARDPSPVREAVNLEGGSSSSASKEATAARDTFAALDAESSSGTTNWIHAGTRSAEAGFNDPALGWVGVRADASGGGVHASLVPGSADAAVTLGGHLAELNSYLAEQHTPVDSLTLAATEDRSVNSGMGQGAQQSMHQDMHQGGGQDTGQGGASGRQSGTEVSAPVLAAAASMVAPAASGRTETAAQAFIPGGTHISVMA